MSATRFVPVVLCTVLVAFAAPAMGAGWSSAIKAERPPGYPAGLDVFIDQVACPAAGQCVAMAFGAKGDEALFDMVFTQSFGVWGTGQVPPLPASAPTPKQVQLYAISCPTAGACTVVGSHDGAGAAWTQDSGGWTFKPLSFRAGQLSCTTATDCLATTDDVLVTESHGRWGAPVAPQLPANAAPGTHVPIRSASCGAPGSCVAVVPYVDAAGRVHSALVVQRNGQWQPGFEVPAPAGASSPSVALSDVDCWGRDSCTVLGSYASTHYFEGYPNDPDAPPVAVEERNATWSAPVELPMPADNGSPYGGPRALSCLTDGRCEAFGDYTKGRSGGYGTAALGWSNAAGSWTMSTALNDATRGQQPGAFSCWAIGECEAAPDVHGGGSALLSEDHGTWTAPDVVQPPAGATGPAARPVITVSCAPDGYCAAGGSYKGPDHYEGMLFTKGTAPSRPSATEVKTALAAGLAPPPTLSLYHLVKQGGVTTPIVAPGPGTATITWAKPGGKARAAAAAVLARGSKRFKKVGKGAIRVVLTSAGKRALRGKKVTLVATAAFRPNHGRQVRVRTKFTLRR